MEFINIICYNFESDKNKVLEAIQTQKKAMRLQHYKGSTIAEYNYQFMNRVRFAEACGGTFKIPEVIYILLRDKHNVVAVSQLDPTSKKALKDEVRERVLAVLFIDNSNRRI